MCISSGGSKDIPLSCNLKTLLLSLIKFTASNAQMPLHYSPNFPMFTHSVNLREQNILFMFSKLNT